MRIALPICGLLLIGPACAGDTTDYTGIWKGNCSDGFGIQIRSAENGLYSVSFCGPGGCFEPGQWTSNTTLEGDPTYKIVSPTELRMKRPGGHYETFVKCTSDPSWVVEKPADAEPQKRIDCSVASTLKEDDVVIAWITDV